MSVAADHEVVRLAERADEDGLIEGARFQGAVVLGPAIIVPLEDVTLNSNTWVIDPNSLFIEFPEGTSIAGAIGLRHVTIQNCELRNVAIAGTPKVIDQIRTQFQLQAVPSQAAPAGAPH